MHPFLHNFGSDLDVLDKEGPRLTFLLVLSAKQAMERPPFVFQPASKVHFICLHIENQTKSLKKKQKRKHTSVDDFLAGLNRYLTLPCNVFGHFYSFIHN